MNARPARKKYECGKMSFVRNRIPWLLATVIFAATSIIESSLEEVSPTHDVVFFTIAMSSWLVLSTLFVYGFKWTVGKEFMSLEDYNSKYVDKPMFLILLSLCTFIAMLNFMVLD